MEYPTRQSRMITNILIHKDDPVWQEHPHLAVFRNPGLYRTPWDAFMDILIQIVTEHLSVCKAAEPHIALLEQFYGEKPSDRVYADPQSSDLHCKFNP